MKNVISVLIVLLMLNFAGTAFAESGLWEFDVEKESFQENKVGMTAFDTLSPALPPESVLRLMIGASLNSLGWKETASYPVFK